MLNIFNGFRNENVKIEREKRKILSCFLAKRTGRLKMKAIEMLLNLYLKIFCER